MALIQKAFSDIITFSRSSNATRVGPTGLVEYAPHNLILQSQTFDNASWTKTATTITANSAAAPDGTVTADQLAATSTLSYTQQSAGSLSATLYTISFYFKAGTSNWAAIELSDGVANANGRYFDLASVAVGGSTGIAVGSTVTVSSASATNVGNGWVRCSVTFSLSSATTYTLVAYVVDGNNSKAATIGKTIFAWGAQLAVGPYALDYTPTTTAAVYGPRFDFDPVTLAARGLLVEEQRTNLLTYSEQINLWPFNLDVTVTSNSITAPDGQTTAETITSNGTNNGHVSGHADVSMTSGASYVFSFFVKQNTARYVQLLFGSGAFPTTEYANFDLQTGTVVGGDTADATISALANGWYRITYRGVANKTDVDRGYLGLITSASAARAETFTEVLSVYAWGAQFEAGSFATSYIPTLASTVTRSADVASVNTLSPWFNATEGTLYAQWQAIGANPYSNIVGFSDGTTNNVVPIYRQNSETLMAFAVTSGGTVVANISQTTPTYTNSIISGAGAYKVNDFATSFSGNAASTDTSGAVASGLNTMSFGGATSTSNEKFNGYLRRIAYYPRRLTNAELQALSA